MMTNKYKSDSGHSSTISLSVVETSGLYSVPYVVNYCSAQAATSILLITISDKFKRFPQLPSNRRIFNFRSVATSAYDGRGGRDYR